MGNALTACSCGKDIDISKDSNRPFRRKTEEWISKSENGFVRTLYGKPSFESASLELFEEEAKDEEFKNESETTEQSNTESRKKTVQFDEETLRQQRLEYLKKYIHDRENKKETALTKAVHDGSAYKVIEELIETGEDVDARDQNGDPILYTALFYAQFGAVRLLLNHGADVNYRNSQWDPIIYTALQTNKPEILKLIIEAGADVDCRNSKGDTILYSAILSRQISMIEILLQHGADANLRNTLGTSCLEEAMTSNQIDVMRLLVHSGADVDIKDKEGNTLLHVAMMFKQVECLKVLLSLGADVNLPDKEGNPVLEMAILMQDLPSIELLLQHGANVNLSNVKGIPVYFKAITRSGCDIMKFLINNGVEINCRDSVGNNATFAAIEKNNCDVIKILIDSGIDNNIVNNKGQTCLDYATSCTTDKSTIVQTLLESGTVQGKEIDEKYFTDKTTHNEEWDVYKGNFVSFCDRALFLTSKQSKQHIKQWVSHTCHGKYWFFKVNIFCDHFHIDCIVDSRLQMAYSTLKEITVRRSSKQNAGDVAVDTDDFDDPHPFEADEPKAVTEFEVLLTTINKIRDGLNVNSTARTGDTLLHLAVKYRHNCLVRYILQNGGNPYKNNTKSVNPVGLVFKLNDQKFAIPLCNQIARDFSTSTILKVESIWSGWTCGCKQGIRPEREVCSDQCAIAAYFEYAMPPHSFFFKGFYVYSGKRKGEFEAIRSACSQLDDEDFPISNKKFLSYNWNKLFREHKNLLYVYPSLVKSKHFASEKYEHEIKHEYCIRLVCSVKGVIPIEETHFPETILGFATDCVELNDKIAVTMQLKNSYQLISFLKSSCVKANTSSSVIQYKNDIPVIDSCPELNLLPKPFNWSVMMNIYDIHTRAIITFPIDNISNEFYYND